MTELPRPAAIPRVSRRALPPARLPAWMRGLILACCLIEVLLFAAGLLGYPVLRFGAFGLGAFWSPLFWQGSGLYPGQNLLMFLSYGVLHGGILHLGMNMISLAAVGRELARFMRPAAVAVVYLASQVGGAMAFAVLQPQAGPMIGASGAVFGLAGALVGHAMITLRRRRRSTLPLIRAAALILGLNVALTLLLPAIAWQAHLGGAATGLVLGVIFAIRSRAA